MPRPLADAKPPQILPSLQGVIRYRIACQASALKHSIILCKEQGLRLWRCSATETPLSQFMQVRSKLPAKSAASSICKICSAVSRHHAGLEIRLQLEKQAETTKSPPQQTAEEPNKYSDRLLHCRGDVAGLAASRVQHCWLQPYQRQDHLRFGCSEERAGNQS